MDNPERGPWRPVDSESFRATLGHFPTGVVLVTGLDDVGQPVGMVVGSFTSVSLDPPLVAFLPSRSSQTYARLKASREIVVNVLSSDQEWICRRFAAKAEDDKWRGVQVEYVDSGIPVVVDAVVSIRCEVESTTEAGDHDIVIGRVISVRMGSPLLPLLFFQGGYGRFTPSTLVAPTVEALVEPIRLAELARPGLEQLAISLGVECAAVALVEGSIFTLAGVHNPTSGLSPQTIGRRVPFVAPVGTMFVAEQGAAAVGEWLGGLGGGSSTEALLVEVMEGLERARLRGYSIVLETELINELDRAADALSGRHAAPLEEARYHRAAAVLVQEWASIYEPQDPAGRPIRILSVPVHAPSGAVALVLQLRSLASGLSREDVSNYADALKAVASNVEDALDQTAPSR